MDGDVTNGWPRGRGRDGGIDSLPLPDGAGDVWLCGKHAIGPDVEATLTATSATTVVCLTERFELIDRYPAYVQWLDDNNGGRAVLFPISDLHAPSVEEVLTLVADLRARVGRGETLLMHCAAGIGRTGTLAACLLIEMGMGRDEALAHVGAHRPMAGPEVGVQRDLVEAVAERAR